MYKYKYIYLNTYICIYIFLNLQENSRPIAEIYAAYKLPKSAINKPKTKAVTRAATVSMP